MRVIPWRNGSSWTVGDPDAVVWTSLRAMRRVRAVRVGTFACVLALAAALGAIAGFVFMK